ncbi:MAG: hypothetical protein AAFV71_16300 [Cyanobacteria bacterium J06633_8]
MSREQLFFPFSSAPRLLSLPSRIPSLSEQYCHCSPCLSPPGNFALVTTKALTDNKMSPSGTLRESFAYSNSEWREVGGEKLGGRYSSPKLRGRCSSPKLRGETPKTALLHHRRCRPKGDTPVSLVFPGIFVKRWDILFLGSP